MGYFVIALADMSRQYVTAGVVLLIGLAIVAAIRASGGQQKRSAWLPIIALIACPVLAAGALAAEAFVFRSEHYIFPHDQLEMLPAVLTVGTLAGAVVAVALAIENRGLRNLTVRHVPVGTACVALAMGWYVAWGDMKATWMAALTGGAAGVACGYSVEMRKPAKIIVGVATFIIVSWIGLAIALFATGDVVTLGRPDPVGEHESFTLDESISRDQ